MSTRGLLILMASSSVLALVVFTTSLLLTKSVVVSMASLYSVILLALIPASLRWRIDVLAPKRQRPSKVLFLALLYLAALLLAGLIALSTSFQGEQYYKFIEELLQENTYLFVATVVTLAPLSEELVFRAIIYTVIKEKIGAAASVCLSSLLFALLHYAPYGIASVVIPFLLGLVLAVAYEWFGYPGSTLLHSLHNMLTMLVAFSYAYS